jgi:hypothetical protein
VRGTVILKLSFEQWTYWEVYYFGTIIVSINCYTVIVKHKQHHVTQEDKHSNRTDEPTIMEQIHWAICVQTSQLLRSAEFVSRAKACKNAHSIHPKDIKIRTIMTMMMRHTYTRRGHPWDECVMGYNI